MSEPTATFVAFTYRLRYEDPNLSQFEKHHIRGQIAVGHLTGLGRLLCGLTSDNTFREFPDVASFNELRTRNEDLDAGLYTLGEIIRGIADEAYASLEEMAAVHAGEEVNDEA